MHTVAGLVVGRTAPHIVSMPNSDEIPFGGGGDAMWMLLILALVAAVVALRWWRISRNRDRTPPPEN